jgi:hypothetical protein
MATTEVRDGRPVVVRTGGAELAAEAELLATIAGPGVPEVVEVGDGVLVTTVAPPVPSSTVAGCVGELATVLARAHAAGVVHGPIHDEHVQGAPGALLLGGWTGVGNPAEDVAELGRLLERHGGDPALVARALAPDPPSMAALAESLAGPRELAPRRPVADDERPRIPTVALAALVVVLAVLAAALVFRRGGDASPTEPAAAVVRPTTTTTAVPTTTTVLEHDGHRWTVGEPGDVVVVGDWNCDGTGTPAVVRPTTGEVWLFSAWTPEPDAERTVDGAATATVEHDERCDRLVVQTDDGQSTTVG